MATVNVTGVTAQMTNWGTGYTVAPQVTVQGTCTQRPTATAVISGGSVRSITLNGPINCTTYPTLSIVSQNARVCREIVDGTESRDF